jgi:acetylornithine/N-succinyldiaminopimelate aminotransferase
VQGSQYGVRSQGFGTQALTIAAGDNVIRLLPPLIVTDDDITEAVNKLEMTCRSLEAK